MVSKNADHDAKSIKTKKKNDFFLIPLFFMCQIFSYCCIPDMPLIVTLKVEKC